jgi:hydroxymethylpyrimidine/phosphomethylpyrimidine kinase
MIMNDKSFPCVVTIAGTDPSGGAGVQADIKAISATGAYAASIITALVAQNTQGVQQIVPVSEDFIQKQMDVVFGDLDVHAVKIGMLQDARIIELVSTELSKINIPQVILDPVMIAKDGSVLLDLDTITFLKKTLLPYVTLITPNLFEAEYLSNSSITSLPEMEWVAKQIGQECQTNVLVKGGHLNSSESPDILYIVAEDSCHWFHAKRIPTKNTHGTGCSLSSAIASYLAQGKSLIDAVASAKQYISMAIESGAKYSIGRGCGPVDHFYFLKNRT